MTKRKIKITIGSVVVLFLVVYLVYSGLRSAMVYYVTVGELKAGGNPTYEGGVRLGGKVVEGSVSWNPRELELRFEIADEEESVPVVYKGIVPDTFKEGREVVLEGIYAPEGVFKATELMTKCPSKYEPW